MCILHECFIALWWWWWCALLLLLAVCTHRWAALYIQFRVHTQNTHQHSCPSSAFGLLNPSGVFICYIGICWSATDARMMMRRCWKAKFAILYVNLKLNGIQHTEGVARVSSVSELMGSSGENDNHMRYTRNWELGLRLCLSLSLSLLIVNMLHMPNE